MLFGLNEMTNSKKKKLGRPPTKPVANRALMKAIKLIGSLHKLAVETGINEKSISKWLYEPIKIPAHHVPKIVKATKGLIRPEALRPDIEWNM